MRFPKSFRLLNSKEYDHVFQQPQKIIRPLATLYVRANVLGHARLGLLISKREVKRAVARNRIKRLVRESFRHHHAQLNAIDIIFVGRKALQKVDNKRIFEWLDTEWKTLS